MSYISREAAIKALENVDEEAYAIVSQLHAADVAPVVRAYWIVNDIGNDTCSHCGQRSGLLVDDYCKKCGARMDAQEADHA